MKGLRNVIMTPNLRLTARKRDLRQSVKTEEYILVTSTLHKLNYSVITTRNTLARSPAIRQHVRHVKLSSLRNETATKQFRDSFETVLFQFHFVVQTVSELAYLYEIYTG